MRTRFVSNHNSVGFARKKTQTISFVERGFERLGLSHQAVGFSWCSHMVKSFSPRSLSPGGGLGGSGFWPFFPASSLDCLLFLLYSHVFLILRPRVGSTFPRLILVPSAHTQSGWGSL